MAQAPHPRMHGITHVPGGSDPVPGLLPSPPGDFTDLVLSHPAVAHYWPADEAGGDLVDRVGGWDLARHANATAVGYPVYGSDGPSPTMLAVENSGAQGIPAGDEGRFARTDAASSMFAGTQPFSIILWVYPNVYTLSYLLYIGTSSAAVAVSWASNQLSAGRGGVQVTDPVALSPGNWHLIGVRYDGATLELLKDDLGVVDSAAGSAVTVIDSMAWLNINAGPAWFPIRARSAQMAFFTAAITDDFFNRLSAAVTGSTEGLVLGVDESGNPAWVQPKVEVTVNGEPAAPPAAPPAPLPDDPNTQPGFGGLQWIVDQPFVWGGSSFDVPPNKWTTIPFTSPLMERWSNVTGEGTVMTELAWDNPAAAGWINPATPRVITIPHDMPFLNGLYDWMQICLRLEGPMVEPLTSHRGVRVFETTNQKTLVSAVTLRDVAVAEGGATDVFRDLDVSWTGGIRADGIFASGDSSGLDTGNHDTIMFGPTSGAGYQIPGVDWLPRVAGVPTLKKGMRLIPQVWHDAHTTLTFHCDSVAPDIYRPHFVVWQGVDRAWGPPWSDWPLYVP